MKLGVLLVVVAACGGAHASAPSSTTEPVRVPPTSVQASATTRTTTPTQTTVNKRPEYSCFTYTSRNSAAQRTACMRSEDCGPYLDQAKQETHVVEVSGCATVDTVFCFMTGDEEVCQPTLETCNAQRTMLVRSGTAVQGECAKI